MNAAPTPQRSANAPAVEEQASRTGGRFFDAAHDAWMVKVFPGEYYITDRSDEIVVTVLGSCVAACIRDPHVGIGGMNHFMLPHALDGSWGDDLRSTRFGNYAMEKLINELVKAGCARERLEIKVFGGGNVTEASNAIGSDNAEFVLNYLAAEGLHCAAKDLGGSVPRRIHYYPTIGRVVRRLLSASERLAIGREEQDYGRKLQQDEPSGEIQLFGDIR